MSFKRCKDLILGIVMLAFSGFYLINALQIKTRPKLVPEYASSKIVPIMLGILLAALATLCIVQGIRKIRSEKKEEKAAGEKTDFAAIALTFAVVIAYTSLMQPLGFCLSTVLYLFAQMLVLAPKEKRNYLLFAIVAVVFTAVIFVAFRIALQQLLPRGVIESLLGF